MKKIIVIILLSITYTSCTHEFGTDLGGYKYPKRRVCIVGNRNSVWTH